MKRFLKGKNIVIGIITLVIGVVAVIGIARAWSFQTTTVSGNVVTFIINPEGKVDGVILDTVDQVNFGAQTGEIVAGQVKIGEALGATGFAGSSSPQGREFKAKTLQIGNQTITVVGGKPHPEKGNKDKRPHPPKRGERPESKDEMSGENADSAPKEITKTNSNVHFVLIGRHGEMRGLILADGTQIPLPKEVKDAEITFSEATNITVEGEISKSAYGNFIKPTTLTIDNQTFSFNR